MPKAQGGRDDFLDIFQISFVTGCLGGGQAFATEGGSVSGA